MRPHLVEIDRVIVRGGGSLSHDPAALTALVERAVAAQAATAAPRGARALTEVVTSGIASATGGTRG